MIEILFFLWFFFVAIATFIGDSKNQPVMGLMLGLLFGPLGILIAWLLPYKPIPDSDPRVIIIKVKEEKDASKETQ